MVAVGKSEQPFPDNGAADAELKMPNGADLIRRHSVFDRAALGAGQPGRYRIEITQHAPNGRNGLLENNADTDLRHTSVSLNHPRDQRPF
jgi:hypothetical protein